MAAKSPCPWPAAQYSHGGLCAAHNREYLQFLSEGDSMGTQALAQMAEAFNHNRDAFISTTLTELATEVPELDDPSLQRLLAASATQNVVLVPDVLSNAIDPHTVTPPSGAIAYTQRAVQQGIPLSAILRAYRYGQMRLLNACFAELPAMSSAETAATLIEAMNVSGVLHDRVTALSD